MKSPITLLSGLLLDFKRLLQCEKGLDRDLVTIKNRFEHEGVSFLAVTLSTYCEAFELGLATGRFTCPSAFSKVRRGALPKLFSGLLCEVFDLDSGLIKSDPSIECIRCIREVTRLYRKLRLDTARGEVLHAKASRSFVESDQNLTSAIFNGHGVRLRRLDVSLLSILRDLDSRIFEGNLQNKHGPGAVREGSIGNQKWSVLYASTFEPEERKALSDLYAWQRTFADERADLEVIPFCSAFGGVSKYITVPKTATAVRGITIEPLVNQFGQQGLNIALRDAITRCPVMRQCLDLNRQETNQKLALDGSRTGEWATIDLSSASDLLSLSLVKRVFRNSPLFLEQAISCRSNLVEIDKTIYGIRKFAGMGNALTFPIQSVVFAILCINAVLEHEGLEPTYKNVLRASKSVQVFGDDIVIRTEHFHTVEAWITEFGLKVNTKKSFYTGKFRESCGTDAYDGVDVTPTYLRVDPCSKQLTSSDLSSLVSTSNQLWLKGLYSASDAIRQSVESRLGKLPLVNPDSGLLGWHDRQGSSEAHSWDPELQRLIVKGKAVRSKFKKDKLDDVPALIKFFHTSLIERREGHLVRTAMRYKTRIVAARAPAVAGVKSI